MSPSDLLLAKQECSQLLQQGLIEPTDSDWACQAFYVEKRSELVRDKKRLVIDYQPLNTFLKDDKFPLPKIQTLFVHLQGARIFSKFDLKVGFWQLGISPVDRPKTVFYIPNAHYQWTVMPFGLKVAPSLFQKVIAKIFSPILHHALVYIESHQKLLLDFFHIVQEHRTMLSEKKSSIAKESIDFLGMTKKPYRFPNLCMEHLFLTNLTLSSLSICDDELWYMWCLTNLYATKLVFPVKPVLTHLTNPEFSLDLLWTLFEWPYFHHPETRDYWTQDMAYEWRTYPHPYTLIHDTSVTTVLKAYVMELNNDPWEDFQSLLHTESPHYTVTNPDSPAASTSQHMTDPDEDKYQIESLPKDLERLGREHWCSQAFVLKQECHEDWNWILEYIFECLVESQECGKDQWRCGECLLGQIAQEDLPITGFNSDGYDVYPTKQNGHFLWDVPGSGMCDPICPCWDDWEEDDDYATKKRSKKKKPPVSCQHCEPKSPRDPPPPPAPLPIYKTELKWIAKHCKLEILSPIPNSIPIVQPIAFLNWQTQNASAQNDTLLHINSKVEKISLRTEQIKTKVDSITAQMQQIHHNLQSRITQLDLELRTMLAQRYYGPEFDQKEREIRRLKAKLDQIESEKQRPTLFTTSPSIPSIGPTYHPFSSMLSPIKQYDPSKLFGMTHTFFRDNPLPPPPKPQPRPVKISPPSMSIPGQQSPSLLYKRPSSFTRSIRTLISTRRPHPKEYIQSSRLDQCALQATSAEQYVTLEIPSELLSNWKREGYTHLHLGGIRLILTLHGRKGLSVTARLAMLDTRFKQYQDAVIGIILTTLHAGSVLLTFYPNFNLSLQDPNLPTTLKVQVQIQGAEQISSAKIATLHHQLVYRLQNHALDLPTPEHHSDTLMILAESDQIPTIIQIPRQIPRHELIKLMPLEWISNYEQFHNNTAPIQTSESLFERRQDGTVRMTFKPPPSAPQEPPRLSFTYSSMITADVSGMCDPNCPYWDDWEEDDDYSTRKKKPKKKKPPQDPPPPPAPLPIYKKELKWIAKHCKSKTPSPILLPTPPLTCMMFSSTSSDYSSSFPPLETHTDSQRNVVSKRFVSSPITSSDHLEPPKPFELVLNWQTQNARAQNDTLLNINSKVENISLQTEQLETKVDSISAQMQQIHQNLQSRITQLDSKLRAMLAQRYYGPEFDQKEREIRSLKAELAQIESEKQRPTLFTTSYPIPSIGPPYHPFASMLSPIRQYDPSKLFGMTHTLFRDNPLPPPPKPKPKPKPQPPPVTFHPPSITIPGQHSPGHTPASPPVPPPLTESQPPSQSKDKQPMHQFISTSDSEKSYADITRILMAQPDHPPQGQTSHTEPYVDIPSEVEEEMPESSTTNQPPSAQAQTSPPSRKSSHGPWFTFDDLPSHKWRDRLNEMSAWIDLQMLRPGAITQSVLREFATRFTVSSALVVLHDQFLGDHSVVFEAARRDYLNMKCCSLNAKDLDFHYKRMSLLFYKLNGFNEPTLKHIKCKQKKDCDCSPKKKRHFKKFRNPEFSSRPRRSRKPYRFFQKKSSSSRDFKRRKSSRCFICKKKGHYAKDCPNKREKSIRLVEHLQATTYYSPEKDELEFYFSEQDEPNDEIVFALQNSSNDSNSDQSQAIFHQQLLCLDTSIPIPSIKLQILPSKFQRPVLAIGLIDTGAQRSMLNPHILPPEYWIEYKEHFKAVNGKLFTTSLITKKPIGIQIFPNCVIWTKVIDSTLPNKDLLLGSHDEHRQLLTQFYDIVQNHRIMLSAKKSTIAMENIEFLGMIIKDGHY
ncbi:hypothetical protein KPL70_014250 [Citrus sinensis]|nr:hypothetical protein KPL70_014250 [Citrus sinensis]